jgi:Lysophospholipase
MFKAFHDTMFGAAAQARTDPALEVIERRAPRRRYETPVLFIHGAFAGAWCWDEYFLPYFASRGFDAYAVSLRGHGNSEGRRYLHMASIADYVHDVDRTVRSLERPPVLVGHSMGGMVVQKYLERHAAPAAVLMASVPPTGLALPTLRLMLGDPWLLTQINLVHSWNPHLVDFKTAKRAVFSDDMDEEELLRHGRRFRAESQRALWDMTVGNLPQVWRIKVPPLLVLGAENDALFPPAMVRETARVYGAEAEIFPGVAHAMMLERRWRLVADRIIDWLARLESRAADAPAA